MNTAIAQHLNVAESAILEVQEWARVLWVKVRGLGARFVSKKVIKKMKIIDVSLNPEKAHDYEVVSDGNFFRVSQQMSWGSSHSVYGNFEYVVRSGKFGNNIVERADICEAVYNFYQAEINLALENNQNQPQAVKAEQKMMDDKEALDCWFGEGKW